MRRRFSTKDATKDELPDVKRSEKKIFQQKMHKKMNPQMLKEARRRFSTKAATKAELPDVT